jgi:hypothetical protein
MDLLIVSLTTILTHWYVTYVPILNLSIDFLITIAFYSSLTSYDPFQCMKQSHNATFKCLTQCKSWRKVQSMKIKKLKIKKKSFKNNARS